MGLVTLEYAPLWFIGGIVGEQIVIKNTLKLCWAPNDDDIRNVNDDNNISVTSLVNGSVKQKEM